MDERLRRIREQIRNEAIIEPTLDNISETHRSSIPTNQISPSSPIPITQTNSTSPPLNGNPDVRATEGSETNFTSPTPNQSNSSWFGVVTKVVSKADNAVLNFVDRLPSISSPNRREGNEQNLQECRSCNSNGIRASRNSANDVFLACAKKQCKCLCHQIPTPSLVHPRKNHGAIQRQRDLIRRPNLERTQHRFSVIPTPTSGHTTNAISPVGQERQSIEMLRAENSRKIVQDFERLWDPPPPYRRSSTQHTDELNDAPSPSSITPSTPARSSKKNNKKK